MSTSPTKQAVYRRKQQEKGLVAVSVYVRKGDEYLVKDYAKTLRDFRDEEDKELAAPGK